MSANGPSTNSSNASCIKSLSIGCGALGCVGMLVVAFLLFRLFTSEGFQKGIEYAKRAPIVAEDMKKLLPEFKKFKTAKGRYPISTVELSEANKLKPAQVRPSFDATGKPFNVVNPDTQKSDTNPIILTYDLPAPIPAENAPPWTIKMRKNGEVDADYSYSQNGGALNIKGSIK